MKIKVRKVRLGNKGFYFLWLKASKKKVCEDTDLGYQTGGLHVLGNGHGKQLDLELRKCFHVLHTLELGRILHIHSAHTALHLLY